MWVTVEGKRSRIQSDWQVKGDTVAGSHMNKAGMKAQGWQPRQKQTSEDTAIDAAAWETRKILPKGWEEDRKVLPWIPGRDHSMRKGMSTALRKL